jgi:hypothetical protein
VWLATALKPWYEQKIMIKKALNGAVKKDFESSVYKIFCDWGKMYYL